MQTLLLALALAAAPAAAAAPIAPVAPVSSTANDEAPGPAATAASGASAPTPSASETAGAPAPVQPSSEIVSQLNDLWNAGSDDAVVKAGETWLREHPADVDVRLAVVRSLVRKAVPLRVAGNGYLQTAWNHLQAALKTAPDRMDVRVALCDVLYHLGRREALAEAIVSFLEAAPSKEDALDAVSFYAEEDAREGRPESGADIYRAICSVLKDSAGAALNHGTMLVLAGQLDEALAEFQRSARLDPKNSSAAHSASQVLVYLGDYAGAREWLLKALAIEPASGRFLADLAVVSVLTRPKEATGYFDRADAALGAIPAQKILVANLRASLTAPSLSGEDALRLVTDLQHTGYPIYAIVAAEKVLRADPNQPEIVLTRADIYDQGRFWKQALVQYRSGGQLAAKAPQDQQARLRDWSTSGMARTMARTGEAAEAVRLLRSAGGAERFPLEMADALWRSGEAAAAMDLLEHIATKGDDDVIRAARQKMQEISTSQR